MGCGSAAAAKRSHDPSQHFAGDVLGRLRTVANRASFCGRNSREAQRQHGGNDRDTEQGITFLSGVIENVQTIAAETPGVDTPAGGTRAYMEPLPVGY
jgi:hypothetical protein